MPYTNAELEARLETLMGQLAASQQVAAGILADLRRPTSIDMWNPSNWTPQGWDTSQATILNAGADLQAALNNAKPGDILLLEPAVWTGNYVLPRKPDGPPITIATKAWHQLPQFGKRVYPGDISVMPQINSPNNDGSFNMEHGAHHWRLYGVAGSPTGPALSNGLWEFGVHWLKDQPTKWMVREDQMPHHIDVVQCLVQGHPERGGRLGIRLNASHVTVRDSFVSGWTSPEFDTQAIFGITCQDIWVFNNYLEASGENFFLSELALIPGFYPRRINVYRNHIRKPLSWREAFLAGRKVGSVKNLLELKSGQHVHIHSNLMENSWWDGQTGYAIVLKPGIDASVNPALTEDVIIENNLVRNATCCVAITGVGKSTKGIGLGSLRRVRITNNLFLNIGANWGSPGRLFLINGPVDDITIERNTVTPDGQITHVIAGPKAQSRNFVFCDNVLPLGAHGVKVDGTVSGQKSITAAFPDAQFTGNVFTLEDVTTPAVILAHGPGNIVDTDLRLGPDGRTNYSAGADIDVVEAATGGLTQHFNY